MTHEQDIIQRLTVIETTLQHVDKRLFGNGQPGELECLESRVSAIEKQSWKIAGAMGLGLFLLNFFTGSGMLSAARLFGP